MSLKLKAFFILITLTLAGAAHAEGPATKPFPRFGLGANLNLLGMNQLHVPILINKTFRLEPTLGLLTTSKKDGDAEESSSNFNLGLGLFYNLYPDKKQQTAIYVGPRLGMTMNSTTADDGNNKIETSRTDMMFGLAAGAEYFFTRAFSIGGEVQMNYMIVGKTETKAGGQTNESEADESNMSTMGMGVIRWYFL